MIRPDFNSLFTYENGNLIRKITRSSNAKAGSKITSTDSNGYKQVTVGYKRYSVHRVIWEMFNGPIPAGMQIDHANGVRDDNRIENLRLATIEENNRNRGISTANTSGVPGVFWIQKKSRWLARITIDGERKYLGHYRDKCEAISARKRAEIELFGEFAPNREAK